MDKNKPNYLLYNDGSGNCFIDLGLMMFNNFVQFPHESIPAFLFNINDEGFLKGELVKILNYLKNKHPNKLLLDFKRINMIGPRAIKTINETIFIKYPNVEIIYYNIENNINTILDLAVSDISTLGSEEFKKLNRRISKLASNNSIELICKQNQAEIKSNKNIASNATLQQLNELKDKQFCQLLLACAIDGDKEVFHPEGKIANKYFDVSLLFRNLANFKFFVYYLILELINWINNNKDKVRWIKDQTTGKDILKDKSDEVVVLVSSSATGSIIANAVGCLLGIPTIFFIALGPEDLNDEITERIQKGFIRKDFKDQKLLYVFDIMRNCVEFLKMEAVLKGMFNCKFYMALGFAHLNKHIPTISLIDLKKHEKALDYLPDIQEERNDF